MLAIMGKKSVFHYVRSIMKYSILTFTLSLLTAPILAGAVFSMLPSGEEEETHSTRAVFTHPNYSQEELIATRIAWNRQEELLGKLMYIAGQTRTKVIEHSSGNKYVGSIDANNKTITTRLSPNKSVSLSYADLTTLLDDKGINAVVKERSRE
jgi:hypothetical protein